VLWTNALLGEPKDTPAATVAPFALGLAEAFTYVAGALVSLKTAGACIHKSTTLIDFRLAPTSGAIADIS